MLAKASDSSSIRRTFIVAVLSFLAGSSCTVFWLSANGVYNIEGNIGSITSKKVVAATSATDQERKNVVASNNTTTVQLSSKSSSEDSMPTIIHEEEIILNNRTWDRMLFGIFTYDGGSKQEALRQAHRDTHLSYYKNRSSDDRYTVCSLHELMTNSSLTHDPVSCRIVYTFVMGGGEGADILKKKTLTEAELNTTASFKTRCLYEDPECGGTDISRWTIDKPRHNASQELMYEVERYHDITFLSIAENHNLGKTDTFLTYAAMLTREMPQLQIGFVGKLDSDAFINHPAFFRYLDIKKEELIDNRTYIFGGQQHIRKATCSGRAWGFICAQPSFIAPFFFVGDFQYLSTPLAQHVYMDGTSFQNKTKVWMPAEDVQVANMAYSDVNNTANITVVSNAWAKGLPTIVGHHQLYKDGAGYREGWNKVMADNRKRGIT